MLSADSVKINVVLCFCRRSNNPIVSSFFIGHFAIFPALPIDSFIFAIDFLAPGEVARLAIGVGLIFCNISFNCWRIPSQSEICSCLVIPIADV